MNNVPALLHDGILVSGAATLMYGATVTTTALVAVLARDPQRRRAARDVLALLLRRPPR